MSHQRRILHGILVAATVLPSFACSTEQRSESVERGEHTVPSTQPVRHRVTIEGMQFVPATLTAAIGDTVVVLNKDMLVHNVTEARGNTWTSGPIPVQDSVTFVAKRPMSYFCSLHPSMTGEIVTK